MSHEVDLSNRINGGYPPKSIAPLGICQLECHYPEHGDRDIKKTTLRYILVLADFFYHNMF